MLLGNYSVLHKLPVRFFGGSATSVEVQVPSNFRKSGSNRNRLYVSDRTAAMPLYSVPSGNVAGRTWMPPQKSGEMSSRNDSILSLAVSGGIVGGITTSGSSSFGINFSAASGQLISSGSGSASFTFSGTGNLLASIDGSGSASFSVTTNSPTLGALASLSGSSSWSITSSASILPIDDTSPARTASASFTITGSLVPYAIGQMVGSTVDNSILTGPSIAASVWGAVASSNNDSGTMGSKLNTASSGGVDLDALAAAVWASTVRTLTGYVSADVKRVNGTSISGSGLDTDPWGPAP